MSFNEANTVEAFVRDRLCGGVTHHTAVGPGLARRHGQLSGLGWHFLAPQNLPRQPHEVLVEDHLREALIRLNPEIAAQPDRADDVLYKLRAIVMGVRSDGLVKANEEFAAWLTGERSMPFGENGEHVTIRLIDFDDLEQQPVRRHHAVHLPRRRHREARRPGAARQRHPAGRDRGEDAGALEPELARRGAPGPRRLRAQRARAVRAERLLRRHRGQGVPLRLDRAAGRAVGAVAARGRHADAGRCSRSRRRSRSMLRPHVVLDLLANFTAYATDKKKRRIKIIARYQQYEGANKIVERVVAGHPKKGLIWHFQGSGKSLLMLFAARKLRLHPALKNPTVMIVVDRIDLDTQISSTFYAADMPNLVKADSRAELQRLLAQDVRKIIITTIFKFGEADGVLNDRSNIIAMVDEAHRTQEGDLGRKMREALPNAFLFGLTGTPINRADRNTFYAFGADEDERGYMSRYGFEESIRDGATMPLHFEPRLRRAAHRQGGDRRGLHAS